MTIVTRDLCHDEMIKQEEEMAQVQPERNMNGELSDWDDVATEVDNHDDNIRRDQLEELQTQPLPPEEDTEGVVAAEDHHASVFGDVDNILDDIDNSDDFVDSNKHVSKTTIPHSNNQTVTVATTVADGGIGVPQFASSSSSSSSSNAVVHNETKVLSRKPYESTNFLEGSSDECTECAICLEPLSNEGVHRIVATKCGHLFGLSCLKTLYTFMSRKYKCPMCQKDLIGGQEVIYICTF